jgi:hypothetical protein
MTFRVPSKTLVTFLITVAIPLSFCQAPYAQSRASETYGKLPLSFEANLGQTDPRVKFLSRGSGYTLFLTRDEAVMSLKRSKTQAAVHMRLVGSNPNAETSGESELAGTSNYFIGNDQTKWRTGVPTFSKVRYKGVYRGVDLIYYGNQGRLEYDFVIAPNADPTQIGLAINSPTRIDGNGEMVVSMDTGELRFQKPLAYQITPTGGRKNVGVSYGLRDRDRVGFRLATYNHKRPLIIDPILSYSTYLGGDADDRHQGLAVDGAGNIYLTGTTTSTNFPTVNPLEEGYSGGGRDAFVTKVNSSGTAIAYSTYLGGNGDDLAYDIAVDTSGNAYVAGSTSSANFPVVNSLQAALKGTQDAFIAKLDAAGSGLVYSTYLGGSDSDDGLAIGVDGLGFAYIVGDTVSTDFPVVNAFQGSLRGVRNGFVSKVKSDGSGLVYSTYLGGSGAEQAESVAVDLASNAYITGITFSSDFPTFNPIQSYGGGGDAFVTKMNASGSALIYSTFLGGSGYENATGIALDAEGNAYLAGRTQSSDFPTKNATQPAYAGNGDIFVTKINAAGSALVYSTYLGGSGQDLTYYPKTVAVDQFGSAIVGGSTYSSDFPTVNPSQAANAGAPDAVVVKFNTAGSALVFSSYLGGSSNENLTDGSSVGLDAAGNIYVYGDTTSTNFPTVNPIQPTNAGGYDLFLTKISTGASLSKQKLVFPPQVLGTTSAAHAVTLTNLGNNPMAINSIAPTGDFNQTNNCGASVPAGGNCTINVTFSPSAKGVLSGGITIADSEIDSPQNIALSGTGTYVKLAPTALGFAPRNVGTTSPVKTITLTNTGSTLLTFTGTRISTTGNFAETNTCGARIAGGASCTISVTFTPTATGTRQGSLVIMDNGGGNPQKANLSGTGR